MSCGCGGVKDPIDPVNEEQPFFPTYQLPNETIECYAARTQGDPQPDPETQKPIDKIATINIAADCQMKVNTTFKMTPESQLPVTWELELKDGDTVKTPDDLGLTFDQNSGLLSGTVNPEFEKKTINASMKAKKSDGSVVDEKVYTFVAKKCDPSDLKFIHPSPGSRTGDRFGNRFHPIKHVWKQHNGQDFCSHGKNDILASADGVVSFVGVKSGYGNCIIIDHKDASGKLLATTLYGHLAEFFVKDKGQQVAAGTPIGHEGMTGGATGPHLHFEIRLNGTTPVDPLLYINGTLKMNTADVKEADDPNSDPTTTTVQNKNKGLTKEEINAKTSCTPLENNPQGDAKDPTFKNEPGGKSPDTQAFHKSACRPPDPEGHPDKEAVKARVNAVIDKHPELDAEDRKALLNFLKIECTYDPYAANTKSSALGPYQMLNATAGQYYKKIGVEPTCENRCNVEYATEAEIAKYKEDLAVYNKYHATGKILGRVPPTNSHTAKYPSLSKGEFMYTIHHDGIGSVQRGNDLQGLGYFKTHAAY